MSVPQPTHDWSAPVAGGPVDAVVPLPGSKSMTNRAMILAATASGSSRLHRPLSSRDTRLMAHGLRALPARHQVPRREGVLCAETEDSERHATEKHGGPIENANRAGFRHP